MKGGRRGIVEPDDEERTEKKSKKKVKQMFVGCLMCSIVCVQFYVLQHRDRSCRSKFLSHLIIVYRHRANQRLPYKARQLTG